MKIKLKKDVQLSRSNHFCGLEYKDWLDLNNGKVVEFDKVPELIKGKTEEISSSKGGK